MPIRFNQETKEFHLYNDDISYILSILPNGHVENLYYGKRVDETASYLYLRERFLRPLTAYVNDDNSNFSLQHTRQEYATYGTGDYSLPAFKIRQSDGNSLSHFVFKEFKIYDGKKKLDGLPQTYTNLLEEAKTLELHLFEAISKTSLILYYTIFENYPVLTRSVEFEQLDAASVVLEKALSMSLDLPDSDYEWLHLDGAWGRERYMNSSQLHQGTQGIYSLKGVSSSEHNPFMALKRLDATEHYGEVISFSLVYSGNFMAQVDVSPYHQTRVSMGIHPDNFSWELSKGEKFQTPEVVMVYSDQGLNGMSQTYHRFFQNHLVRGYWKKKPRPILLNNWEAMSFHFNEKSIKDLAQKASEIGIELFVMDDGWFGHRDSDTAGLGDWHVNLEKLPSGLSGISRYVHDLGMLFGLWIEPEMVNKDSKLYQEHPDWILHHPSYSQSPSRHQYTLDFSREDVFQNIYQQLRKLLLENKIDYIKWDMNRYMTEVYSVAHTVQKQGEVCHRYILNIYRLYEKLIQEFPHVLFESCASGGARFDPGMLYYAPQTWTSDDTDAFERLKIQYGTSLVYPLSTMGCHVSDVPNQQTHRNIPIDTRGNVAYFGSFGYELDLRYIDDSQIRTIKEQISFYKTYRSVFQYGCFTRLASPFVSDRTAWQVIAEDSSLVIVGYYRHLVMVNGFRRYLKLRNLDKDAYYECGGKYYKGDVLMRIGLVIDDDIFEESYKDFSSKIYILKKLSKED